MFTLKIDLTLKQLIIGGIILYLLLKGNVDETIKELLPFL